MLWEVAALFLISQVVCFFDLLLKNLNISDHHLMPQSKKIQEQLDDIYQCRKGGGAFSKALGLQRTTASATWTTNGENVERC